MQKQQNKLFRATLIALVSVSLLSCLNQSDFEQSAYGDAFIKSVYVNDSVVGYNVQLFTYSWSEMKEVSASLDAANGTTYQLDTIDNLYTFAYQSDNNKYESSPPVAGNYNFKVVFANDEENVFSDYLSDKYLTPPRVSELVWDSIDHQIKLEWEPVPDAQVYSVTLLNPSEQVAFETEMLDTSITKVWINQFSYGWRTGLKPTENTTYKIIVSAFLFEPVASTFDIQSLSVNNLNSVDWKLR